MPALTSSDATDSADGRSAEAASGTALTVEQIQQLLPHRYPFALVDRIEAYVPGERATGIKNVTFNEPHFQGHIPGRPIMPGVLIVEAMAQVGGVVLTQLPGAEGSFFAFAGMDKVRFRRPVVPGDRLRCSWSCYRSSAAGWARCKEMPPSMGRSPPRARCYFRASTERSRWA